MRAVFPHLYVQFMYVYGYNGQAIVFPASSQAENPTLNPDAQINLLLTYE